MVNGGDGYGGEVFVVLVEPVELVVELVDLVLELVDVGLAGVVLLVESFDFGGEHGDLAFVVHLGMRSEWGYPELLEVVDFLLELVDLELPFFDFPEPELEVALELLDLELDGLELLDLAVEGVDPRGEGGRGYLLLRSTICLFLLLMSSWRFFWVCS